MVNALDPLLNFMLQQELLSAETILSQTINNSFNTEGPPGDFPLLTLCVALSKDHIVCQQKKTKLSN